MLGIGRQDRAPLLAPIWYRYTPGGTVDMCMGSQSAKATRLRAEGRATLLVVEPATPSTSRPDSSAPVSKR